MKIAPTLMTNETLLNMRIVLLVVRSTWAEQSGVSRLKKSPQDNVLRKTALASGSGEQLLRRLWADVFGSPQALARLGITTGADGHAYAMGIADEEVKTRLWSFVP